MPNDFGKEDVVCPFFRNIRNRDILCEGITDDCITILRFKSYPKMKKHCEIFCCKKYDYCEISRILEEKYEE